MMKKIIVFLLAFLVLSVVSPMVIADANDESRLNYLLVEEQLSNALLDERQQTLIDQLDNAGADVGQILTSLRYIEQALEDSEPHLAALIAEAQSLGLSDLVADFTAVQTANQNLYQETNTLLDLIDNDRDAQHVDTDNCPTTANANQADADGDDIGDACDTSNIDGPLADADSDGVLNGVDNCPANANANQANSDNDSLGNVCDATPNGEAPADATPQTLQERFDELENQFQDYEDDYDDDLKDDYNDAVRRDDEDDIEDAEDDLKELKDDLKELRNQAKELEDEVESDDSDNDDLLDDIEDLIDDVTGLRDEVSRLLSGEVDEESNQNDFDYVSDYVPPRTTTITAATPTGNVVLEPLQLSGELITGQATTPTTGTQWESIRNMVWIAGGVVILLAIILFLIALLVK